MSISSKLSTALLASAALGLATTGTANAATDNPALSDDAYVTLTGTVGAITENDRFELNYSGGTVMVDTNDNWPNLFTADADEILNTGDKVVISGRVDDNLFSKKEIDATAISFVDTAYSRVYYNEPDGLSAEERYYYYSSNQPNSNFYGKDSDVRLTGYVSKIENDEEFILNYGSGSIQVDVDDIAFTNTDKVRIGDRVTVFGGIDKDWYDTKEIEAEYIVRENAWRPRG